MDEKKEENLSAAAMKLINLEEFFFFSGVKTGKSEYFDLLSEAREMRKALLKKLTQNHEGETWCVSKHLLASAARLTETGAKLRHEGKNKDAEYIFSQAGKVYSLFRGLRLKLINLPNPVNAEKKEKAWTTQDIVNKLVNCCDEGQ